MKGTGGMGSLDKVGGRFLIHGGGFYVKLLTTGFLLVLLIPVSV